MWTLEEKFKVKIGGNYYINTPTEVTQLFSAAPALGERGSALGN
jgi:hypothetical protein